MTVNSTVNSRSTHGQHTVNFTVNIKADLRLLVAWLRIFRPWTAGGAIKQYIINIIRIKVVEQPPQTVRLQKLLSFLSILSAIAVMLTVELTVS